MYRSLIYNIPPPVPAPLIETFVGETFVNAAKVHSFTSVKDGPPQYPWSSECSCGWFVPSIVNSINKNHWSTVKNACISWRFQHKDQYK